jgi:hypothetical protein
MVARKKAKTAQHWRVTLLKGTPAKYVGRVEAADRQSAIDQAAKIYRIDEALKFKLVAEPDGL